MSALSVNDHLEGILSDFEALKRSFDIEDVDDLPPFTPTSPVSTPVSPSSPRFFLNHRKASDGRAGDCQSPSLTFNNNNNLSSAPYHSRISLSSSPSPVMKPRNMVGSMSFNHGTTNKPALLHNSSSVTRAASFQSRLNPNGFSMSGPGSDNDSLHSSTSSLEYSGGGVGLQYPTKLTSYPSPQPKGEYRPAQQLAQQGAPNSNSLKKFSSHGSVFHSEVDQGSGMMLVAPEPHGVSHGSMPSLDLQIRDGGGGMMHRSGGRISPGLRFTGSNSSWNGRHHNASHFGEEGPNRQQQNSQSIKSKDTPRLNKFPLDLDNLVSNHSTHPPSKVHRGSMSPTPPKPPPRSTGSLQLQMKPASASASASASPSASLSSLDSSSDAPSLSLHHPFLPFSTQSPTSSQGSIPVPEVSSTPVPLSPAQTPQLETLSGPQRIASFTRPAVSEKTAAAAVQRPVHNNGGLTPESRTLTGTWRQEKTRQEVPPAELDPDLLGLMEEREEKERGIMGEEHAAKVKPEVQPEVTHAATAQENGVEAHAERQEKGMQEDEMKRETEEKIQECLEMSYIHGTDLFGYVGIEAVLDQMRRKTMKTGFEFNIMVVGQSGLGKSTLVNTLFKSKVSRKSCTPNYEETISKTVKLQSVSHIIEEKGVKMKLTVIDTPGFGDQINNDNCWDPIVKYINEQYEKYLREELHVNRKRRIPDSRVHCCIYFLAATGHRLRPIDIEFMKRLGKIVSIVPVIAKADTLTIEERQEFKERIRQDLAANAIQVYPQKEYDEDPEEKILNDRIRESIPFAVVGTDKEHQVNGHKVLGRKTKWGIIEVENVAHCEFANLRDLLIRSHLQDLKDVTHNIHYETYRVRRLNECNINFIEKGLSEWPLENGTADRNETESHL
ncbi:uncharacterized protein ACB058_020440 isoform 2-T2 [Synchiropus picturatus]